jgi:peptidoglycan hydrolase-like protein with peptidoglycan-binding domain
MVFQNFISKEDQLSIKINMQKKFIVGVVAVAMVFSVFGTFAVPANAQTMTTDNSASAAVLTQFNRNLTIGSSGADVAALQTILVAQGHLVMPAGVAKGYFGPLTRSAVAKWQAAVGITPAAGYFGPISRARINAAVVANPANPCPAGYAASGMNPVICTPTGNTGTSTGTSTGNNNNNNGPLRGGEASLEDYTLSSGNEDEVEEGESAEVAEIEFDVEDGDVRLERLDLTFEFAGSGDADDQPWDVFESISLMMDGEEIASEDVSDEDDWLEEDEPYVFRFSGLNEIVREGETASIMVEVTAQGTVDGADDGDASWMIYVDTDGIRAIDAEGIDQYTGDEDESTTFDVVAEGEGEELNVSEADENPEATTLAVEDDMRSDWYNILSFNLEAEEGDIEIDSIPVMITTSGTTTSIIDDLMLEIDGEEFDDFDVVASSTATSREYTFDINGDYTVEADSEVLVNVMARFKAANGTNYSSGATVMAEIEDGAIEGEGGDDITSDGSAEGDTHTLATEGVVADLVSKDDSVSSADNPVLTATFVVDVEAFEEDAFVELSAREGSAMSGTGFNVVVLDGNNNATTTAGTVNFAVSANKTETANNRVRIGEDQTVRFTVKAFFDAAVSGSYKIRLYSVNFNETDAEPDEQHVLFPESEYRTTGEYVSATNA